MSDKGEYWTLTDYGRTIYLELRRRSMLRQANALHAQAANSAADDIADSKSTGVAH